MRQETESVASRIDIELKTTLERAAAECDVSKSAYLESIIKDHVARNPNELVALQRGSQTNESEPKHTEGAEPTDSFVDEMLDDLDCV